MAVRDWDSVPKEEKYFMLGDYFDKKKQYEKAFTCFKKADNNPEATERIGEYYYFGKGVDKNISLAKKYFKLAADAGNVEGMYNYACCESDNNERYLYCKRASDLGCTEAMNMIGLMIKNDEISADESPCYWFKKAAEKGDNYGAYNYRMVYRSMVRVGDCVET